MPELPEVETVRRTLLNQIKGKTIDYVDIRYGKIIQKPDDTEIFKTLLVGETVENIRRRGKFLLFDTAHYALVSHLRMEGKFSVAPSDEKIDKHTHVIFSFTDGTQLRYNDVRKFGTMHLFPKGEEMNVLPLSKLGPEPTDPIFDEKYLSEKLKKTARKIKPALLDQYIVVGLGNIYVDEALHRSYIHPERIASSLNEEEVVLLHREIVATLAEAVEKGGSSIRSYVNAEGKSGSAQKSHLVYGKTGEPCRNCGMAIEKIKVGGRGTHFCPCCQRK